MFVIGGSLLLCAVVFCYSGRSVAAFSVDYFCLLHMHYYNPFFSLTFTLKIVLKTPRDYRMKFSIRLLVLKRRTLAPMYKNKLKLMEIQLGSHGSRKQK